MKFRKMTTGPPPNPLRMAGRQRQHLEPSPEVSRQLEEAREV